MRTRAAVVSKLNEAPTVEELEVADPGPGEVLVRMVASGVCHTDVSAIQGIIPTPLPVVLGHEGAGIVEAVGPGVATLAKGDHVVTSAVSHCRICRNCLRGQPYYCEQGLALAFGGALADGTRRFRRGSEEIAHFFLQSSWSELAVVPEQIAIKVPEELPLEKIGPLACGVGTGAGAVMNTADVHPGETVVVFGCGGVGLSAVMAARVCRASRIIAVDMLAHRLETAKELGATDTVNPKSADVVEAVQALTAGGPDWAFECIGRPDTIRQAVDCIRPGGTAVVSGVVAGGTEVALDGFCFLLKNIRCNVEGSVVPSQFIPLMLELWQQGAFPFDKLLGAPFAHADIGKAIGAMESGEVIKPVVVY